MPLIKDPISGHITGHTHQVCIHIWPYSELRLSATLLGEYQGHFSSLTVRFVPTFERNGSSQRQHSAYSTYSASPSRSLRTSDSPPLLIHYPSSEYTLTFVQMTFSETRLIALKNNELPNDFNTSP